MKSSDIILVAFMIGMLFAFGCDKEPMACTEDARLCPDGSSVVRNPDLNCEFNPCPNVPAQENICDGMGISKAIELIKQSGDCLGELQETFFCNHETRTWWIDLKPAEPKEGCSPACVVNTETNEVEINWRCTGALPPE